MADEEQSTPTSDSAEPPMTFARFLETIAPNREVAVLDLLVDGQFGRQFDWPVIELYCDRESCDGPRFFAAPGTPGPVRDETPHNLFVSYVCRNCRSTYKTFALNVRAVGTGLQGVARKYGEMPRFGPHIPARVIRLIGPDRDLFLKGRQAEIEGLAGR
ncbi:MAG: hypothetical protein ACREL5_05630 [Gemmatimonadales bacterium]